MNVESAALTTPVDTLRLSELTARLDDVINGTFRTAFFWVIAEVSSYRSTDQGHKYFEFIERHNQNVVAKISARAWQSTGAAAIRRFEESTRVKFANDLNVLVKVKIEYSAVYGLNAILIDVNEAFTVGMLAQQRELTLIKLLEQCPNAVRKDGDKYITRNGALPLPRVIQRIALVTSKSADGCRDFEKKIHENAHGFKFFVDCYDTRVQGQGNARTFRKTLIDVFNSGKKYDAVVIVRGGGSDTDFLMFDSFEIGEVVAKFPVPVFTGIGHQRNETVADLVAHTAAKTPSEAAEIIVSHNRAFAERIVALRDTAIEKAKLQLKDAHTKLQQSRNTVAHRATAVVRNNTKALQTLKSEFSGRCNSLFRIHRSGIVENVRRLTTNASVLIERNRSGVTNALDHVNRGVENVCAAHRRSLAVSQDLLASAAHTAIKDQRAELRVLANTVSDADPINVLKRGYAIVRRNGAIVTNAAGIKIGDAINVQLEQTSLAATVTSQTSQP